MNANNNAQVEISAVITRADGTVEDLGVICRTTGDNGNGNGMIKNTLSKVKNFVGRVIEEIKR